MRPAAAWLLALVLLIGTMPPIPSAIGGNGPDAFVAADLCSSTHGVDPAQAGGPKHDCGGHCCILSGKVLPPAPLAVRPLGLVVAERSVPDPSAEPDQPSLPLPPARAPPFLAA
ncbi:DUF2946 family protein [Magnetospirillum sp. XM-1]|uniref:DUF2946 family protein n=1 Tax=Magnetospirillum sp. XM-1 TaxID=1663591 RepID=UPI000839779A|nr:DUF2946 family protein [Magnetospirillum sp. XM-1]